MIILIILAAVFTICYLLLDVKKERLKKRLTYYTGEKTVVVNTSNSSSLKTVIKKIAELFETNKMAIAMDSYVIKSGLDIKGSEFLVITVGISVLSGLLTLFLSKSLAIGSAIIGAIIPFFFIKLKTTTRQQLFNNQLGDALILIANALKTGYSFLQALEVVAKEMPNPIAFEFSRTIKEINLGIDTEVSLEKLTKRVGSNDLDLVVTAVLIQRQVGGNLAQILINISETIRERVKIKRQIKTLTAQGRISGVIIGALPIAIGLFIYLINPGYIGLLFTKPLGQAIIAGSVVSYIIGIIVIRNIINIDV